MPYAAFTAAAPTEPAALLASLPATSKLRGNPNSAHAPAQPARGLDPRGTRTGCPCRSPAIHSKLRCPAGQARGQAPHGGRNPSQRTPETLPRRRRGRGIPVCDVRTIHGTFGSNAGAENHDRYTLLRIGLVGIALDRYQAHLPTAPSANSSPQGAPMPSPTARFKPSRIDPLNREPMAKPGSTAPFKPFRTDPLNREPTAEPGSTAPFKPFRTDPVNREPGTFPDPDPHSVHRLHETPHVREPWRCAAHAEPAPQARNFRRG